MNHPLDLNLISPSPLRVTKDPQKSGCPILCGPMQRGGYQSASAGDLPPGCSPCPRLRHPVSHVLSAQTSSQAIPARTKPWTRIPIPPLHAFKPIEPRRIELANGLVILLAEDHELPFINGRILIRGGSRDEPAAKAGLVSLYGTTWRTSGTVAVSGDALDEQLDAKAADVETGGGLATTSVTWSSLTKDFDTVFGITMQVLLHPDFKQDKLQLAKRRTEAGIARRNDDPSSIAGREATQLVYGKSSPYARETEYATVEAVTLNDLKQWHERTVSPNNMILALSGDFDSAAMEAKLRAAFASLPKGKVSVTDKALPASPTPGVYFVE